MDIADLCMKQNAFQFRDKIYTQNFGTSMGNPISPLISEIFMSRFETELSQDPDFPRFWRRYVDDVYAVCNRRKVKHILQKMNLKFESIKFTVELEKDNFLSFLELGLTKLENGKLDISVYRKPTNTPRLITSDSSHHIAHKMSAFHSMAHRLVSLPLTEKNYEVELKNMCEMAVTNGYTSDRVKKIVKKHKRRARLKRITSLSPIIKDEDLKRLPMPYVPGFTEEMDRSLRPLNISVAPANRITVKNLLESTKDKVPNLRKSGVYKIRCQDSCNYIYIGRTLRNLETRFAEHMRHAKNGSRDLSAVAKHLIDFNHDTDISKMELVKSVNNWRTIDIYESAIINEHRDEDLMNNDDGMLRSKLFRYL